MSDRVFRGIADPVRREILELLRAHELPVEEIASHFPVSRPAISKHLRVLREAGLVSERKSGRQRFYALAAARLQPAQLWLEGLVESAPYGLPEPPAPGASPARSGRTGQSRQGEPSESVQQDVEAEDWRSW